MDRKQVTALVLLDLSKAFDSIDKSFLWAMERKVRTEERKQSKGETIFHPSLFIIFPSGYFSPLFVFFYLAELIFCNHL